MRYDVRPLDTVRSIKVKLGLLVAVTVTVASVLAVVGTRAGLSPWATVPVAVLAALGVTQLLARGMTSPLREMTNAAQQMATGDYSQRVQRHLAVTRSASWPGRSTGWRPRSSWSTGSDATWWPTCRTSCARRSRHSRPCSRTSSTGCPSPDRRSCGSALAQTERLGRLVNDLLDLSRVEEGVTPLRFKDVRLSDFLTRRSRRPASTGCATR